MSTEQSQSSDTQQNADIESADDKNNEPSSQEPKQKEQQKDESNNPPNDDTTEEPQNDTERKEDQPKSSQSAEIVTDNDNSQDSPKTKSNEIEEKSDASKSMDKPESSAANTENNEKSPKATENEQETDNPKNDEKKNNNKIDKVEESSDDPRKSDSSNSKPIESSSSDGYAENDEYNSAKSKSEENEKNSEQNQDIYAYGDANANDFAYGNDPNPDQDKQNKEDSNTSKAKESTQTNADAPNSEDNSKEKQKEDQNKATDEEKKGTAEQNQNIYSYGDANSNDFAYASDSKPASFEYNSQEKEQKEDKDKATDEEKKEDTKQNQNLYTYGDANSNDFAYGSESKPASDKSSPKELESSKSGDAENKDADKPKPENLNIYAYGDVNTDDFTYGDDPKPEKEEAKEDGAEHAPPMSPDTIRITSMHDMLAARRRHHGNRLPLVGCIRCNNSHFIQKVEELFTATGRQKNWKYAFTFVPDPIDEDVYNLIHVESGSYLTVKRRGLHYTLYSVNEDDLSTTTREDLCFTIAKVSNREEVNLRVTIKWQDRFLTAKEVVGVSRSMTPGDASSQVVDNKHKLAQIPEKQMVAALNDGSNEFEEVEEKHGDAVNLNDITPEITMQERMMSKLDGTDTILVFEEAYIENIDCQMFLIEKAIEREDTDDPMNVIFLLDLVDEPKQDKIGKIPKNLRKRYKHISDELIELAQQIYVRLDQDKTGYAKYSEVWTQFVQYSKGSLPRTLIETFETGLKQSAIDVSGKICHIKNFVATIDTMMEFHENEIKLERLESQQMRLQKANDPIDIKLRRLDTAILYEHPFVEQWQNMSGFRRKLYDWKIWLRNKWASSGDTNDAGFFLWRSHLVNIQGNFGESIFAFFQFTRWLMMLNLIMALFYGVLIFTHVWQFPFLDYSTSQYVDMALGNEFERSWWFYGAYEANYSGSMINFDVGFMWMVVSAASALISIVAVLQVLLHAGVQDVDECTFSQYVFSSYDHSFKHKDAVTLQTNSIMIQLHETLLEKIDDEVNVLTWKLFIIRFIGVLFCIIVGVLSAAGITGLIFYESDVILPWARSLHPVMASISPFIVPAGVSFVKAVTPHIVRRIVLWESYSAAILFQQTFFRVFLLRIFAILVTLFQTAQNAEEKENEEGEACAESQIGMVLYKFIMFDMIIEIVTYGVIPGIKYCCGRCCGKIEKLSEEEQLEELNRKQTESISRHSIQATEFELAGDSWKAQFDIPGALVDVMYRQGIVWSGMYFSPMIPPLAIIASIVTFFVKKRYLFGFCARPKKALGVTKQLKFFYGMMLLAIVTSFIPLNYLLGRTPSCGPHQQQHVLDETETTLDEDMPIWLRTIFSYIFNGLLLLPILILTLVYLGYVRGTRKSHEVNAKQLKERLLKEKAEKKQICTDYNIRL